MPMLDKTGPWGTGPIGLKQGPCFGAAPSPATPSTIVEAERAPTSDELALWDLAENGRRRAVLYAYIVRMKHAQIVSAAKHAKKFGTTINLTGMAELEERMNSAILEIDNLRKKQCAVSGLQLGVKVSDSGGDLDIVSPTAMTFGAVWIPIAIGAVVVAGIIARWAYLEKEVVEITNSYNGVISKADMALCADPDSSMCKSWKKKKQVGDYHKKQTLIDQVGTAVKKIGGAVATGTQWGILIALPVLAYALSRK